MFTKQKKINFSKSGSGTYTAKTILPIEWIRHLGITKEDSGVKLELVDDKIIITKADK